MGKQKVALVLSMGGARGIAHIGVIEELFNGSNGGSDVCFGKTGRMQRMAV